VLTETIGKLGVEDLWQKLGNETRMKTLFKTASAVDAKKYAMTRLDGIMAKRNWTIHRGVSFVAPTDQEVKDAAEFFDAIIDALADVLEAYIKTC
jgi:hypothetical protein